MSQPQVDRLAAAVTARRHRMGVTQAQLAKRGGPSTETLRLIENGLRQSYGTRTLAQLENVLQWRPGVTTMILDGVASEDPDDWVEPDRDDEGRLLRVTMWQILDGEIRTFLAPLRAVPTHERSGWQRIERIPESMLITTFRNLGQNAVEVGAPGPENDNVKVEPNGDVHVVGIVTDETDEEYVMTPNDLGLRRWPKERWARVRSPASDLRGLAETARGSSDSGSAPLVGARTPVHHYREVTDSVGMVDSVDGPRVARGRGTATVDLRASDAGKVVPVGQAQEHTYAHPATATGSGAAGSPTALTDVDVAARLVARLASNPEMTGAATAAVNALLAVMPELAVSRVVDETIRASLAPLTGAIENATAPIREAARASLASLDLSGLRAIQDLAAEELRRREADGETEQ